MQETFSVAAFVLALTELVKKLGITGNALCFVAMAAGIIGQVIATADWTLPSIATGFMTGLTTTGVVGFGKSLIPLNQPAGQ